MNSRTMGMFADDAAYPALRNDGTTNEDPGFKNDGDVEGALVAWMTNLRNMAETTYWGYDADGDRFGVTWPYEEDLGYTNENLVAGSTDGFPVGDLNWFPELKEQWQTTAIKTVAPPDHFTLKTNYPNPFQGNTTIEFNLQRSAQVNVTVYSADGKLIQVLANQRFSSGQHQLTWEAGNRENGVYYFLFRSEGKARAGKMVKMN